MAARHNILESGHEARLNHVCTMKLLTHTISAFSARQEFVSPTNTNCACPGEKLIYTCSAVTNESGRATVWSGSAFDCAGSEITLLHDRFSDGTIRECNGGAILGRSVSVDGNCFTSQLNVTVSTGLNNKTVKCFLDSEMQVIGESLITVTGMYCFHYHNYIQRYKCRR